MSHRAARSAALLALVACTAGCVTEVTPVTPGSRAATTAPRPASRPASTPASAPQLPAGPVARAVTPEASVSAQVRTMLLDLGSIPYDGQVLPLVSPDGRFVATQVGEAPTWPTLIAAPGAEVPHATQLRAFSLPDPEARPGAGAPAPAATPIAWSEPRAAVLLGRSADTTGFLIEAPQPDGSRWIGRISWISGELTWLVQGTLVNSGATLGPAGELAWCRRSVDDTAIELVVRTAPGAPEIVARVAPGATGAPGAYFWPMCSDEPGVVYAFALSAGNAEVHALRLPKPGDPRVLAVVGRQPLFRNADATRLSQVVASSQTPLPSRLTGGPTQSPDTQSAPAFDKILFFHPGQGRMVAYDRRTASLIPLFPGSVGATPLFGEAEDQTIPVSGYLVTTPKGLEYIAWSQKSSFDERRGVPVSTEQGIQVMAGAQLARLTTSARWPAVLMGPDPGGKTSTIHLFRLRLEGVAMESQGR